ncbi:MAG: MFS transporter [Rhodospirillaceae bacterium]|jgi:MFS family permease|nr:MFS transporter [Rhodospirillaceae bacterium]MBT4588363.1 MFS transporter [Rhodospirillaceae bacterium]MBT4940208.1 MFS transporter [Rhodospirillaceae bacterium]MBT5938914.1 MFS transporter [Rhodospirillaceae bacterium]MBT7266068.1 MFS transporter [Rhodospirillaceae bacterium]
MSNFGYFVSKLGEHGMGRALRHRDFTIYALAGWLSNIGLWVQKTALFWLTWELTKSYSALGGLAFAEAIMTILVMPYAGTLTDRFDRLKMARISQASLLSIGTLVAMLSAFDLITIEILFGLVMINGVAEGFWTPLRMTMPPSLVPREDLPAALGISATLFNLAQFVGPALGGVIVFWLGVTYAFSFNAASFLGYFFVLFIIKLRYEEVVSRKTAGFIKEFKEGLIYIAETPGLRRFLVLSLGVSLLMRAYRELFAGISDGIFGMGVEGLAILSSAAGLGAMFTAIFLGSFGKINGLIRIIMIGLVIAMVAQIVLATTNIFWVAVACAAVLSGTATYAGIGGQLLVQNTIHGAVRGRVMSIWGMILRGGPASGAWMVGTLAGVSDLQFAFLTATFLFFIIWLWTLRSTKRMAESLERSAEERDADAL